MIVRRSRLIAAEKELRKARKRLKKSEKSGRVALKMIVDLEKENAILKERLDILANYLPDTTPSAERLYVPEDEEDIQYALDTGQIERAEYEQLLREAGALSTEIQLDTGGVPHIV